MDWAAKDDDGVEGDDGDDDESSDAIFDLAVGTASNPFPLHMLFSLRRIDMSRRTRAP